MLILPGFAPPRRGGEDRAAVREAVVSGFCAYSLPVDDPDLAAAIERRLPLVIVDEPRTSEHTFVGIDDRAGARLAAEHVAALGHRRIGVVSFRTTDDHYTGPLTPEREAAATYPVTAARLAGWRDGLEAAGIPWDDVVKEERVAQRPRGRSARACASCSPAIPGSPRCCARPIRSRSARWPPRPRPAARTSRSSASTTSPRRRRAVSRPCASRCWRRG